MDITAGFNLQDGDYYRLQVAPNGYHAGVIITGQNDQDEIENRAYLKMGETTLFLQKAGITTFAQTKPGFVAELFASDQE